MKSQTTEKISKNSPMALPHGGAANLLRRMQFRFGQTLLRFPLAEFQHHEMATGFERLPGDELTVNDLWVDKNGIHIRGSRGTMRFCPNEWQRFWQGGDTVLSTDAAVRAIIDYKLWELEQNAAILLEAIRSGEATFEDIREICPEVFRHPIIANELARYFAENRMPTRKKGKRPRFSQHVVELYNWACWYYVRDRISLEAATEKALIEHPELANACRSMDPLETLLRRQFRKLDSHHALSQLKFRQSRDCSQVDV